MIGNRGFQLDVAFGPRLGIPMPMGPRRLGQAAPAAAPAPSCPPMSSAEFATAASAQNEAWEAVGRNTLVSLCAQVDGRYMQECHFPDGYASAQDAPLSGPPPATCEVLWAQRQASGAPAMAGRMLGQAASGVKPVSDAEFSQVLAAPKAVALFYSPMCPYSQKFLPIYQAIGSQPSDVLFTSTDVTTSQQNAGKYKVRMLPTAVFFVNGQEVNRIDGVQEQSDFTAEMARAFSGQAAPTPQAEAAAPARSGTLATAVPTEKPATPIVPLVLGGLVGLGLLGAIGYAIFGKK